MTYITTLLKKHFGAELLFTDTDGVTYEIKSDDVYEEFFKHKHLFDCSNFSKDFKFYDNQNEIVLGKMKDEYKGIPINKLVGLKSKMHCMLSDDDKKSNTAKGVNTAMELKEYEETLLNKKIIRHNMKRIQGKKHKIGTYEINKISVLCFDDKRFALDDGIHTLAYFHKDLKYRFLQMIIKTKEILKDDYEEEEILTNKNKCTQMKISSDKQ